MAIFTPETETFQFSAVGEASKTTWAGEFAVKTKLSWRDQLQMDKARRELLGPDAQGASPDAVAQAVILSELGVRIVKSPVWWTESNRGLDLVDDNVLTEIFQKVRAIIAGLDNATAKEVETARQELTEVRRAKEAPAKGNKKPLPVED